MAKHIESEAEEFGNDTVVDFGSAPKPEAPRPVSTSPVRPVLVIFDRSDLYVWHSIQGPLTRIGREGEIELPVPDETISRLHAQIQYTNHDQPNEEPDCVLHDLGSRNGTFLNGNRMTGEGTPLKNGDRIFMGKTCLVYYIRSEQEIASDKKLRALATRDSLTGLLNRGFMSMQFQREFDRARRYNRPLAMMMIDIDHFKNVNDMFGHQAGDSILEQVAQQIAGGIRIHDLAGRYGGEEFAVLLPETTSEGAMRLAERVRASVAERTFLVGRHEIPITISIGVGVAEPIDVRIDGLIRRADMALLDAKKSGRNRVVLFEEGDEQTPMNS